MVGEEMEKDTAVKGRVYYDSVTRDCVEYKVGDCCYLQPSAFNHNIKPDQKKQKHDRKEVSYSSVLSVFTFREERFKSTSNCI